MARSCQSLACCASPSAHLAGRRDHRECGPTAHCAAGTASNWGRRLHAGVFAQHAGREGSKEGRSEPPRATRAGQGRGTGPHSLLVHVSLHTPSAQSDAASPTGLGAALSAAAAQVTALDQLTSAYPQLGQIVSQVENGQFDLSSIASEVSVLTNNPTFASAASANPTYAALVSQVGAFLPGAAGATTSGSASRSATTSVAASTSVQTSASSAAESSSDSASATSSIATSGLDPSATGSAGTTAASASGAQSVKVGAWVVGVAGVVAGAMLV